MDLDRTQQDHIIDNWVLAASISAGAMLLSLFLPLFLLITLFGLAWLGAICSRTNRRQQAQSRRLEELDSLHQHAHNNALLLQSLIHAANIPIFGTDEHGHITHINKRACELLMISSSMINRPFDEVITQQPIVELERHAREGNPGHAKMSLAIKGELREFDVSADQIRFSKGAVITLTDITELSRAMTLKTDFVANASHELRTPITSIKGAIETLAGPARDDPNMSSKLIEMIANNANRLELLAIDLLDLSRVESQDMPPNIEELSINEVIEKTISDLTSLAQHRDLRIEPTLETGLSTMLTDRSLLALMLRNLIGNAIKFAHEGTTIRVRAHACQVGLDRTAPPPNPLNRPTGLCIEVVDQGIGIPITQQQRVFERFYQVDDARTGSGAKRGTGLGLAIVKHAARRLGGSVNLQSVHQVGTTVTISLPGCINPLQDP